MARGPEKVVSAFVAQLVIFLRARHVYVPHILHDFLEVVHQAHTFKEIQACINSEYTAINTQDT